MFRSFNKFLSLLISLFIFWGQIQSTYAASKCMIQYSDAIPSDFIRTESKDVIWDRAWKCEGCSSIIGARPLVGSEIKQVCPNCAKPHQKEVFFSPADSRLILKGSDGQIYVSAEILPSKEDEQFARSGEKVTCKYCSISLYKNQKSCPGCGAGLSKDAKEEKRIFSDNNAKKKGLPISDSEFSNSSEGENNSTRKNKVVLISLALLALIGGGYYVVDWGMKSDPFIGTVIDTQFENTIRREVLTTITKRDWRDSIYNGRNIRNCNSEYFGEGPQYQCGTEPDTCEREVSDGEDCDTVDNENGSSTIVCHPKIKTQSYSCDKPKYCTDPVSKDKCDYDVDEWISNGMEKTQGHGNAYTSGLPWPEISQGSNERLIRSSTYSVTIQYQKKGETKTYKLEPNSEAEYLSWNIYDKVTLHIRKFGNVSAIER